MTTARSQLIRPDITPYYHCVSRCVRRSYLCGVDNLTGKSYEHRRDWIEQRILSLADVYLIQICSYAVMSNHYHLVVCIDKESALALSDLEVVERWNAEHQLPPIIQRWLAGDIQSESEKEACNQFISEWRERLYSLSWFMRELNYNIAVQANKEDQCTGRFWEGRFKSQALLDEKALLAAMAYVDLNPVRAKMVDTPEKSDFTSIKARLLSLEKGKTTTPSLANFIGYAHHDKAQGIPFQLSDYLELVDWLGRQIRPDKPGYIHDSQPNILTRLSLTQTDCLTLCTDLEKKPRVWVGTTARLHHAKTVLNKKRMVALHIA
ncbi:transposase [Vibrio tritonius]|uniref:transposase n=1 Tax=Vibrio tritonius TaxID=1435069 RepID=UPI00315CAE59